VSRLVVDRVAHRAIPGEPLLVHARQYGRAIAVGIILAMMLVDFVGPKIVSRAETAIIVFELIILAFVIVCGMVSVGHLRVRKETGARRRLRPAAVTAGSDAASPIALHGKQA
jgi:amino acid transporter